MILYSYPATESGQKAWAFDHETDHANLASGMVDANGSPNAYTLTGALYYFLNPVQNAQQANGPWNNWHQQAHDDAASYYGVAPSLPMPLGQGLSDRQWWLFTNSWEHVALDQALMNQGS